MCFVHGAVGQSLINGLGNLRFLGIDGQLTNNANAQGDVVWITNVTCVQSNGQYNLTFSIAGGSNGLGYDVFSTPALTAPLTNGNWTWLGQGTAGGIYTTVLEESASTFLLLGTPQDSDHDGLTDAYELLVSHSNPYLGNSINPAVADGWAVLWNLSPFAIYDQQTYPNAPFARLGYWRFNTTNYAGTDGQLPLTANASLVPSWSDLAVALTSTDATSQLIYPIIETNRLTDFDCANGTIRFWFQPNWSTGSSNAPPTFANFFVVGNTAAGTWGLHLINSGTNPAALLQFACISNIYAQPYSFQTGGLNGVPVYFQSNLWYQIALTYSPSNIAVYTNGVLLATGNSPPSTLAGAPLYEAGNGVTYYPAAADQASGFNFGTQPGQPTAIRSQLDELESFNYPLTPQQIAAGFPTFAGANYNIMLDSDYDGRSDLLEMLVDGTNPRDPRSVAAFRMGYWRFDSPLLTAEQGQLPLSSYAVSLAPSWSGTALNITSEPASHVTYWDVFTNGWANFNCRQGSVRFWFKPNWTAGPAATAPLLYMGNPNPRLDQWALSINAQSEITLTTASNSTVVTNLVSPPQNFDPAHWSQIVLDYGPTDSSLFINGAEVAMGSPVTIWPKLADRNLGLVIGNTTAYQNSINGQFDELETFNYPLAPADILSNFQTVQWVDNDLDGVPDLLEDSVLPVSKPFLGTPTVITGTVEAEQFDLGGPGLGYFNIASNPPSAYRPTGMCITNCDDLGLGYCLDQTRAGEWVQYSISVLIPQTYAIEARVEGIGTNGVFECDFSGNGLATNTGPLTIPSTHWTNVSAPVYLTNGFYTMRLRFLTNGTDGTHVGRFNYISIYPWWRAGFVSTYTNIVDAGSLSTNDDWTDATNNAAVLQAAVNSLPAGGGTVQLPPGIYYASPAAPSESNSAVQNAAVFISANNVEIAGAGKTNTTLAAYNRAVTLMAVGLGYGSSYTNITLRDLTLEGRPHRAIHNQTNTVFETGQLLPGDGHYTGDLFLAEGVSVSNLICNVLISNCQFLFVDNAIGIPFFVSNCLVTHCDFNMWGGSNINVDAVNNYPTNTANTSPNNGGVGIFSSASPDYNVNVVENVYNGNTNLAALTNVPQGYINTNEYQLLTPNGLVWFQGGGNYFVARNSITNYGTEAVQITGGPSSIVGNTFYTLLNSDACCALNFFAGEPALLGTNPTAYSACFIGNQVYGGRHGALLEKNSTFGPVDFINFSGNWISVFPPLPQVYSYPGDAIRVENCTAANVFGNTLAAGGHGVSFGVICGQALIMNNDFAAADYRGIGLSFGGGDLARAEIVNNIIGQGSTFHIELPATNSFGWFLYRNSFVDADSNAVPPFIDPPGSAVHVSD